MEVDLDEVRRRLGILGDKAPLVVSRAINRTVTNVKKNLAQQTGGSKGQYNIRSSTVKDTLEEKKATAGSLEGYVRSKGLPILLSAFDAKIKPGPIREVSYRGGKPMPGHYKAAVMKRGGRKPLAGKPKAFIGKSRAGLVFLQRFSERSYPLRPLYGPSVPQMIQNKSTMQYVVRDAGSTLQKRIDAEIGNILQRGRV